MQGYSLIRSWFVVLSWNLVACISAVAGEPQSTTQPTTGPSKINARQRPAFITRYDLATREALLLERSIRPLFATEQVSKWPLIGELIRDFDESVTKAFDAKVIADAITRGMPLEGQEETLSSVKTIVDDCAATLGMASPVVFVRNSPLTTAYVGTAGDQTVLVVTSGLLDLFEKREDELRFIVGRELGRVKCDQIRLKRTAYGILAAIQLIDVAAIPDKFQRVLPTLAVGRFFEWCREAEISADRAGLLCCASPEVAYSALMRLLHGLKADSIWINPGKDFDAAALVAQFERWENKPFVKFLVHIKHCPQEAPFIPERIAALKYWAEKGPYRQILRAGARSKIARWWSSSRSPSQALRQRTLRPTFSSGPTTRPTTSFSGSRPPRRSRKPLGNRLTLRIGAWIANRFSSRHGRRELSKTGCLGVSLSIPRRAGAVTASRLSGAGTSGRIRHGPEPQRLK